MSSAKIRIDKELLTRAREYAANMGYSSVEEFISHIIEKNLLTHDETDTEEKIKQKLKGLGYLS